MGVKNLAHRETILGAVDDLKRQQSDLVEYDDGWSSEEAEESPTDQRGTNNMTGMVMVTVC